MQVVNIYFECRVSGTIELDAESNVCAWIAPADQESYSLVFKYDLKLRRYWGLDPVKRNLKINDVAASMKMPNIHAEYAMTSRLDKRLSGQVKQYSKVFRHYQRLAETLQIVLQQVASIHAPLAIVQARPKSIESFAEKIQRKREKHTNPVIEFTDLAGARVITHTQNQVKEVSQYIESHFDIDWDNSIDISQRYKPNEFGYRSVHYIVQFKADVFPTTEVPVHVPGAVLPNANRPMKAEIQVRTLLEHAWADFYHDWIYKKGFRVPEKSQRDLAALAATLEQADGAFDRIQCDLKVYARSSGPYMDRLTLQCEINRLKITHDGEPRNISVALQLARLAGEMGDWKYVIDLLMDYKASGNAVVMRELGKAMCQHHRDEPGGRQYRFGQRCLETACKMVGPDPDMLAALAVSWERLDHDKAADYFRQAYTLDPVYPSILAKYLIHSIMQERRLSLTNIMTPVINAAIERCKDYVHAQVNLPTAHFNMGLFYLVLGKPHESLNAYAKAIQLSVAEHVIEAALDDLGHLSSVRQELLGCEWMRRVLMLGLAARFPNDRNKRRIKQLATKGVRPITGPVVIAVGGCDSNVEKRMHTYRSLLVDAFKYFEGVIVSGGTTAGISGLVGDTQVAYGDAVRTLGYIPRNPRGVTLDRRYQEIRRTEGDGFTLLEPLQNWTDLIASGILPSDVKLIGINGGLIASAEYRLGLAFGAEVGIIEGSGRVAARLMQDDEWNAVQGLVPMPPDLMTVRSFLRSKSKALPRDRREKIARSIHENYRYTQADPDLSNDPSLKVWEQLNLDLQESNRQQADDIAEKLRQMDFGILQVKDRDIALMTFSGKEIETMAEMEHGRWYVERLRAGWRWGKKKDIDKKLNPCLISWNELSENEKDKDRAAVRNIPGLLANVNMEIFRL